MPNKPKMATPHSALVEFRFWWLECGNEIRSGVVKAGAAISQTFGRKEMPETTQSPPKMTARTILVVGTVIFFLGVGLRVGMVFYARQLLQELHQAMSGNSLTDFPFDGAILGLKSGVALSYAVMVAGVILLLIGVVRNRRSSTLER